MERHLGKGTVAAWVKKYVCWPLCWQRPKGKSLNYLSLALVFNLFFFLCLFNLLSNLLSTLRFLYKELSLSLVFGKASASIDLKALRRPFPLLVHNRWPHICGPEDVWFLEVLYGIAFFYGTNKAKRQTHSSHKKMPADKQSDTVNTRMCVCVYAGI